MMLNKLPILRAYMIYDRDVLFDKINGSSNIRYYISINYSYSFQALDIDCDLI